MTIYVEVSKSSGVNKLGDYITEQGFTILSITKGKDKTIQSSDTGLIIELKLDKSTSHSLILKLFNTLDYVNYVEEI